MGGLEERQRLGHDLATPQPVDGTLLHQQIRVLSQIFFSSHRHVFFIEAIFLGSCLLRRVDVVVDGVVAVAVVILVVVVVVVVDSAPFQSASGNKSLLQLISFVFVARSAPRKR